MEKQTTERKNKENLRKASKKPKKGANPKKKTPTKKETKNIPRPFLLSPLLSCRFSIETLLYLTFTIEISTFSSLFYEHHFCNWNPFCPFIFLLRSLPSSSFFFRIFYFLFAFLFAFLSKSALSHLPLSNLQRSPDSARSNHASLPSMSSEALL